MLSVCTCRWLSQRGKEAMVPPYPLMEKDAIPQRKTDILFSLATLGVFSLTTVEKKKIVRERARSVHM